MAQYFALGFGTIIGSAWVVLLGDWLKIAGPGGTILGFAAGGAVMMIVGYCYADLTRRMPEAGSEFIYAYRIFGRNAGFVVGWFLMLYLIGVTVYEAIALPWVLEVLMPSLQGRVLYRVFGYSMTLDALTISLCVAACVVVLNVLGINTAVRFHTLMTCGFLAIALFVMSQLLLFGHISNAAPLFATPDGGSWWLGAGSLFAFCAYGLNGFQAIPQTIEERSTQISLQTVAKILVVSIGLATLFYCMVVFCVSVAAPWRTSTNSPLAAAAAAHAIPHGGFVASALLVATAVSLLKAWNGIFLMATRLVVVMARVELVPPVLGRLSPRFGSPVAAIAVVGALNGIGILFGRGAIEPITDMCAMVLTATYVMCCGTVLLLRRSARAARAPAVGSDALIWTGLVGSAVMTLIAFISPFWQPGHHALPLEWQLMMAWSLMGAVVFLKIRSRYRRHGALLLTVVMVGLLSPEIGRCAALNSSMTGFSPTETAQEHALEREFDRQLDPDDLRTLLQSMSAAPNHVGSQHDRQNAEFMLQKFRAWGWDAHIETFRVLYPVPISQSLHMTAPRVIDAELHEPAVAQDYTSSAADVLPPYAVYGADGDVTAELVYVNYGTLDDYRELSRRGVTVKGRIIIARYGGGWRGTKARLAYEHGAIGCILYSDPRDEGYFRGDVYPRGGWRPAHGVQRGSVLDVSLYPGDPLTPGIGATDGATRLTMAEASTLAKIPVLPISAADAEPLLAALEGPAAPPEWRGALPLTYHIGAGPATVRLAVKSDWQLKAVYDVIAIIKGREFPDDWVIRGNHHDGWVFGALDPLAGNVALMEEAKAIGGLLKTGWRPRRTLIYASWDAEEPGWIGSTEWAEAHADDLERHAVLYVNSDTNARGFLVAGGSHSLQHFANEVAGGVKDPQTGVSVRERLCAKLKVDAFLNGTAAPCGTAKASGDFPLAALGSGTDFTVFLHHLGIASLDLYYSGEDDGEGVWHSVYDSFDNYIRFGDPNFAYGIAEAETAGHVMLRVADAGILPLRISDFAMSVYEYTQDLRKLVAEVRAHAIAIDSLLDSGSFSLAADPALNLQAPPREAPPPHLDFTALDQALARLTHTAAAYDDTYGQWAITNVPLDASRRNRLNAILGRLEQSLTATGGLPGRPWFKHMIYAPGFYSGYDPKTLPGVREAIEQGRWDEAQRYIGITSQVLGKYCDRIDEAVALLQAPR